MRQVYGGAVAPRDYLPITPNDPRYIVQTHLEHMQLPDAWDVAQGEDSTVVIAIVDGGTAWRHEDLQANVWTNPNEIAGNNIDDDNNGFVDDLHGWNFSENKADPTGPTGSQTAWHGTAVAGAAAAVTDNSVGIAGSSWNAQFMGLNVSCDDQALLCFTLEGVLYAGMNGADFITASYGGYSASVTSRMVYQNTLDEGTLVVAASGNDQTNVDRTPHYPSSYNMTLSVGGLVKDTDTNRYNFGNTVNVFAPATRIEVTSPSGYGGGSGTSFSAPLTAGVAALVKTAFPHWGPARIREQVRLSATNIDAANPAYERGTLGRGKVDAYAAVTQDPLPAIRLEDYSYANQNGVEMLVNGDNATLTATFKNYHGDGDNISARLVTEANWLIWDVQEVTIGSLAHGATATVEFKFSLPQFAPNNHTVRLFPVITAGTFEDRSDMITVSVNELGVATHGTNGMEVTVTDEGNIGYSSYQGSTGSKGKGFVIKYPNGPSVDFLYEGGLLIATSASQVSDCIRGTETNFDDQQEDFRTAPGSSLEIVRPGVRTAEEGRVVLTDDGASDPIGVEVLQQSYVDDGEANEDFVIMRYTVTNAGGDRITDVHVGLFFDWDLGATTSDATAYDSAREVGYVLDSAANATRVAGTVLLSDSPTLHYRAIDNAALIYRGSGGGFTTQEKWQSMSSGLMANGVVIGNKDVSQITAAGPFALEPGESVVVAFAVVGGRSVTEFLSNVDDAKAKWIALETNVAEEPAPPDEWIVHAPYPNPAVFPATVRFETGTTGAVEIEIYDVLGRRVQRLLSGARPQGEHTVTWDGRNEHGTRVPSGLYLVRLLGESNGQPILRSRPILVVR